MHIAVVTELTDKLCPALKCFRELLEKKSSGYCSMLTHGRLPNAVPKNSIEEFYGFIDILSMNIKHLSSYRQRSYKLSVNDQAGAQKTDLPTDFSRDIAQSLESLAGLLFVPVANKFEELETYNEMIELSGALNTSGVSISE